MDFVSLLDDGGSKKPTQSRALIIFGSVVGSLTVAITAVSTPFLFPFFRRVCLPYVPATTQQVKNVLEALQTRSGRLVDLGSGDGRIVIAAARQGFQSTGIELNPWLVVYSKIVAIYSGLHKTAKFYTADLWKFDLKPYENVVIFGVETMMDDLEKKLIKELDSNSCIVACRFPLNNLRPVKTIGVGIDQVWVYQISEMQQVMKVHEVKSFSRKKISNQWFQKVLFNVVVDFCNEYKNASVSAKFNISKCFYSTLM